MPGRFFMQKFLRSLVQKKCDFAILEVTSEGIKQKRHLYIDFDVAAITNLKPEHIESHGNFEKYKSTKATIFQNLQQSHKKDIPKMIIVNDDDVESRDFRKYPADKKISFGSRHTAVVRGKIITQNLFQNIFTITSGTDTCEINMNLGGPFIRDNVLASVAIATGLGIPLSVCQQALQKITGIPGRFEIVSNDPVIIVDYAHTVAAVERILSFVRKHWPGEIIHIFGAAGGGRDKWKRPLLAGLSERFAGFSILTEENPFDEAEEEILQTLYNGFKDPSRAIIIPDRKDAIREALRRRTPQTLLLCTAKGSETVIAGPFGRKKPYNEKEFIQSCLTRKN